MRAHYRLQKPRTDELPRDLGFEGRQALTEYLSATCRALEWALLRVTRGRL